LTPEGARAVEPKAVIEGALDRTLRAEIIRAVGTVKSHPDSRVDARRRAREAGEAAIAVLRSEGYYDYVVDPDVGEGNTPQAVIKVTPGPRSVFAAPVVVWDGPAPDAAAVAAVAGALQLAPGAPARSAAVIAAEGRAVAMIQKRGYADAVAKPRRVVVDHADHKVTPTFHLAAGELVHLDGVKLVTKGRTRLAWVQSLATWKQGTVYDPTQVAELERRLRDAGVYDSITVALAPADQAASGLRPVIVSLGDRPPHTLELGGGYSTSEGAGADATWINYNLLRRADTLTLTARLAQIQQKIDAELALPDWRRLDRTLKLGGDIFGDRTPAYDDYGAGLRADLEHRTGITTDYTLGAAVDFANTSEKTAVNANAIPVGQQLRLVILSGLAAYNLDRSNDPLDPTHGWRLQVQAEPTYIFVDRTLPYLKVQAQLSGYLPLGENAGTVLAARVKLGSIIGGNIPDVPANRRFYAGGGGSVRGFDYQGVGPKLIDGTPIGGLSLFETSFEVRQRITGPWSVAAFIDAGSLGQKVTPDFSQIREGAGIGVRYNLGFGPIRLDIATPVDRQHGDPVVQLYVSIGQSF
jgi:translocation and assembly module TamA